MHIYNSTFIRQYKRKKIQLCYLHVASFLFKLEALFLQLHSRGPEDINTLMLGVAQRLD